MKYVAVTLALALLACAGCEDPKRPLAELMKPETCMECHPKHYEQWSGSMHAYAADDPVFIAMNKRGQRDTNGELGDFCIKCHAPMALELGLTTGATFDPAVLPPEAKGVTCFFCHNVESVEGDHNNPLVLAMDQTMRGGVRNAVDNEAHHSAYDELMASSKNKSTMCGACHDLVTPAGVHLERTFAEWKETVFALEDPAKFLPQTCSRCHMFATTEVIADAPGVGTRTNGFHEHMWPGIDQALTPFPQIEEQAAGIKRDLDPAIQIVGLRPLGSLTPYGGICLDPDGVIRVRIDSINVGHSFPSGAAQDRRAWLEVIAYNANGDVVFSSGVVPEGVDPEAIGDANLFGFWDTTYKADNTPAHFFWEVARVDSKLLKGAVTLDPNSPLYDHSSRAEFPVGALAGQIERITARVRMRALPFEVLDELIASGDLAPGIRDQVKTLDIRVAQSEWLKSTAGMPPAQGTRCNPR